MKTRVSGLGGIFFKATDPKKVGAWYKKHLGLPVEAWGGVSFEWREAKRPTKRGATIWSPFAADTGYFKPSRKPFMLNFRVDNLERVLAELKNEKVWVDPKMEESEFGKFGWIMDCDGNRVELWQPPTPAKKKRLRKKSSAGRG